MLVADLTFVASVNPIVYVGARPVLVDAEPETYDMDPALVVEELDRRAAAGERQPAAIEVVHLLGHPAAIEPVMAAAARYGIPVVEDASEALGATYTDGRLPGRRVGTIGRIAAFSFNGNKLITTGGGGMVVTDDEALARRARHLSTQARLPGARLRPRRGRLQLPAHERGRGARRRPAGGARPAARRPAARTPPATTRPSPRSPASAPAPRAAWADPSFWLYTAALERPDADAPRPDPGRASAQAGIEARPIWRPIHQVAALRRRCPPRRAGRRRHLRRRVLPPVVVKPDRGATWIA